MLIYTIYNIKNIKVRRRTLKIKAKTEIISVKTRVEYNIRRFGKFGRCCLIFNLDISNTESFSFDQLTGFEEFNKEPEKEGYMLVKYYSKE